VALFVCIVSLYSIIRTKSLKENQLGRRKGFNGRRIRQCVVSLYIPYSVMFLGVKELLMYIYFKEIYKGKNLI
jgi:hypothetical protein